ncbi:MAG: hypothetical protein AB1632_09320 [Nitrospirota bacterium]
MFESNGRLGRCNICKLEYTTSHIEAKPGIILYVCKDCLEIAGQNFIWICLNCGKVYIRPKELIKRRINGSGYRDSTIFSEDKKIIQGVEMCKACNPEGILDYVNKRRKYVNKETAVLVC